MAKPLVSIIMPTRNRSHFLSDAINSMLQQTYKNWELLILDDNSNDQTKKIVEKFRKKDSRIFYFKNKKQLRTARSRNILLNLARGEFVGHLDDDDYLKESAIEKIMTIFAKNKDLALVYSDYIMVDEQKKIIKEIPSLNFSQENISSLGFRHFTVYKKNIAVSVGGFQEEIDMCEDGGLFMQIAQSYPCKRLPEYLYFYRSHSSNIGHQRPFCNSCDKNSICDFYTVWKRFAEK